MEFCEGLNRPRFFPGLTNKDIDYISTIGSVFLSTRVVLYILQTGCYISICPKERLKNTKK